MKRALFVVAVALATFGYGVASTHYELFPYPQMRDGWRALRSLGESSGTKAGGVWHVAKAVEGDQQQDAALAQLANIPYLRGTKTATVQRGVVLNDSSAAWSGLNLIVSGHAPEAVLTDMQGAVLHRWHKSIDEVFPGPFDFHEWEVHKMFWRRCHLYPNGDLLAIWEGIGMVKLDADSNVLWSHLGRCHHDIDVDEQGRIWTLARHERTTHPRLHLTGVTEEDFVLVLDPDGKELRRISLVDALLRSKYQSLMSMTDKQGDLLHTNAIQVLDGQNVEHYPMWRKGNVLVSMPRLNTVAVLDPDTETITWALTGMWYFEHDPRVLPNGHLLVFDNLGEFGHSKAVEVDPLSQEVLWKYTGPEDDPLSSRVLGMVQRLPNGNTLITESTTGRALEVTTGGDIVWEYYNPARAGDHDELVASLFQVTRLDAEPLRAAFPSVAHALDLAAKPLDLTAVNALIDRLQH